ncbi:MAG: single-stranded DNA-binding protein [Flavobacteriales bacterium]|nr:MAG: single-stranded DNA-binding protein [Flavobacteriales bacterium]
MSIKNKVQLVGHVGQAPELKTFGDSGKLAKFSLATNESYKDKNGQWVENTVWHKLVAWNNVADLIEKHIEKGTYVLIEGKLTHRTYTDKENIKRYITEVEVLKFIKLDKKSGSIPVTETTQDTTSNDDDLPF